MELATQPQPQPHKGAFMTAIAYKSQKFPSNAPLIIENGVADSISLDGCENVIIRNMKVGDQGTADVRTLTNRAIEVKNSRNITIEYSEVFRCAKAISVMSCTDILIDANVIYDLNEDAIRPLHSERVTIRRNEIFDWYINTGKHPDAIQPWNDGLGHDADSLVIEDNCIHRGKGEAAQGICIRWYGGDKYPTYTGFVNSVIRRNLLIGMAYNGINAAWDVDVLDNDVYSFEDKQSKILNDNWTGTESGNKAAVITLNGVRKAYPVADVTAAEEAALVAAWRKRVFPVAVPPVDAPPEPPVEIDPVPAVVSFTQAQKDAVRAALASIGVI